MEKKVTKKRKDFKKDVSLNKAKIPGDFVIVILGKFTISILRFYFLSYLNELFISF
jgi:hypothetical protein